MAGITQKSGMALFPLWSLKKLILEGIEQMQSESTETYEKCKVDI